MSSAQSTVLIIISLLPVFLLFAYVYHKDKCEKEPLRMLLKALLFGTLSTIPAILLEKFLGQLNIFAGQGRPILSGLFEGFVVAGFSEELCKLVLLWWCVRKSPHFNEYFDGIVYAACVALGFAGIENIGYVFGQASFASALHTGIVRALFSVPGHFLFGVAMGYYFALARFERSHRARHLTLALLMPILLHGTYDALLMIPEHMGEGGTAVTTTMFIVFICFDILLWKIGSARLADLQKKSQCQAQEQTAHFDDNHLNNSKYDDIHDDVRQNEGKKEQLRDIDWEV